MTLLPYQFSSYNAYPTVRTRQWYVIFTVIMGLITVLLLVSQEYFSALMLLIIVAFYFFIPRKETTKTVIIDEKGVMVDSEIYDKSTIKGYYFIHGPQISMLFLVRHRMSEVRIYAGLEDLDTLRNAFTELSITEMTDKKESVFDLWIRVLKL